jgi:hypothetical protein
MNKYKLMHHKPTFMTQTEEIQLRSIKNLEVTQWVIQTLDLHSSLYNKTIPSLVIRYAMFVDKWISSLGKTTAIEISKYHYQSAHNWFLYQDMPEQPSVWISTDKSRFPSRIKSIKDISKRDDPIYTGLVLTSLSIHKALIRKGEPDLSTVMDERQTKLTPRLDNAIANIIQNLKWENHKRLSGHIVSTSSGPNGPKLLTAVHDLIALKPLKQLEWIKQWLKLTGSKPLLRDMNMLLENTTGNLPDDDKLLASKISVKHEYGGKLRVYAILDYWTQACFKPLHDYLNRILQERFPSDSTFDQDQGAKRVKEFTSEFKEVYSFDLSAATDRLPADLQRKVLSRLIGNELSMLWYYIMVDRPFTYKRKNSIYYKVGQPMGAYSSWPIMAITHHCIVQYCKPKAYQILGDDVVIVGREAAQRYCSIMERLGVSISKPKSITPKSGKPTCAEFAKRLFKDGQEITPIPTKLYVNPKKNLHKSIGIIRYIERLCESNAQLREFIQQNELLIERLFKPSQLQTAVDFITFPSPRKETCINVTRHRCSWDTIPGVKDEQWHKKFSLLVLETTYEYLMPKVLTSLEGVSETLLLNENSYELAEKLRINSNFLTFKGHPISHAKDAIERQTVEFSLSINTNQISDNELINGFRLKVPLPLELRQILKVDQKKLLSLEFSLIQSIAQKYIKSFETQIDQGVRYNIETIWRYIRGESFKPRF